MRVAWLAAGLFAAAAVRAAGPPDPAPFDAVLAERARAGGFDYRGADGQDRKRLAAYFANLGDADPKSDGGRGKEGLLHRRLQRP